MSKHVPNDWHGPVTHCRSCGHPAPDVPRVIGDPTPDSVGPIECTSCFIGRVLHETVSANEARVLRLELAHEVRTPSLPWKADAHTKES